MYPKLRNLYAGTFRSEERDKSDRIYPKSQENKYRYSIWSEKHQKELQNSEPRYWHSLKSLTLIWSGWQNRDRVYPKLRSCDTGAYFDIKRKIVGTPKSRYIGTSNNFILKPNKAEQMFWVQIVEGWPIWQPRQLLQLICKGSQNSQAKVWS